MQHSCLVPFLFLALDLPPMPLFTDEFERDVIPQVPLGTLLTKYDGKTIHDVNNQLKTYRITEMPPYLVLYLVHLTTRFIT